MYDVALPVPMPMPHVAHAHAAHAGKKEYLPIFSEYDPEAFSGVFGAQGMLIAAHNNNGKDRSQFDSAC